MLRPYPLNLGTEFRILPYSEPKFNQDPLIFLVSCVGQHPFFPLRSYLYSFTFWGKGVKFYQSGPGEMDHWEPLK